MGMMRSAVLDAAGEAIGDGRHGRGRTYGRADAGLARIAALWSADLGLTLDAADVARLMALLKLARVRSSPADADSWIDVAGYAALGAELAGAGVRPDGEADGGEQLLELGDELGDELADEMGCAGAIAAMVEASRGPSCNHSVADVVVPVADVAEPVADIAGPVAPEPAGPGPTWVERAFAEPEPEPEPWAQPGEPHPEPEPAPQLVAPEPEPQAEPPRSPADVRGREGWSPREDVALLEAYAAGQRAAEVAKTVARGQAATVKRFKQLVPDPVTLIRQRKALDAARARVEALDAAGA